LRHRPKHIQHEVTRHGQKVYYYRIKGGRRIRLHGKYGSPEFWENYALAASGSLPQGRPRQTLIQHSNLREILRSVRQTLASAKHRAAKRGLPFDLTEEWALEQINRQDCKCALTGIPFLAGGALGRARAYAPSFDRIDNSKGYTTDNVRIVVFAINLMMLDWGEQPVHRVLTGYRQVQRAGS
jgi:hypothetical protein